MVISIGCITCYKYINTTSLSLVVYAGNFPMWLMFFVAGVFLAKYENARKFTIIPLICTVIALGLYIGESYILKRLTDNTALGIKPSSYIYSISLIFFLFSTKVQGLYKSNRFTSIVEDIGVASFGIYLIHYYLVDIIRGWTIGWLGSTISVLVISFILVIFVRNHLPVVSKYLGFNK